MTFYTQLFTSKRGPLAKVWLAAHWERKLTKAHVLECNLVTSISDIISPKVKIGLRTTGHLLIGVVRIYSKKANYLLTDCSDALVKIKTAFRPGQTDMPMERLEATHKSITLMEDFNVFDAQLPDPSTIDVVDHFSLNQSRAEEITLKEDFGNELLKLMDFGNESQIYHTGLMDMSFQSLTHHGDNFGDENKGFDLLDTDTVEVETPSLNETTLLDDERKAFALAPVAFTSNSERKKGKRKRKLLVDQNKELSDESIREQFSAWSDLVAPMDMAPPTLQLMQWKESGSADKLMMQPCSSIAAPQIKELFAKNIFHGKNYGVCDEVEVNRQDEEGQRDLSVPATANDSITDLPIDPDRTQNTSEPMGLDHTNYYQNSLELSGGENTWEITHPELPSEDSMFVHPSFKETQSTSLQSQELDGQDFEERNLTRQAQKLLVYLKSTRGTVFSLEALCEGASRSRAATTFFRLLILKKQEVLHLQQSTPYGDIIATPGPKFYD
ncbi:double-strand-break repair protein rad21-like protein 1 [Antennarius striatus]|uniref:double-strand-break repair protein rad21-like protein 1 n=1 Tax=Antennarius striatus TaxID=241820 RepID=UPI0035B2B7E1